jgi:hypothetical protein
MSSRPKLAAAVRQKIEDLLRMNLEVRKALNNKVSERQIQRLAGRLQNFGAVGPGLSL